MAPFAGKDFSITTNTRRLEVAKKARVKHITKLIDIQKNHEVSFKAAECETSLKITQDKKL